MKDSIVNSDSEYDRSFRVHFANKNKIKTCRLGLAGKYSHLTIERDRSISALHHAIQSALKTPA